MKLGFVSFMKKMKTESSYENQSQEERKEERWSIAVSHGLTYHFFISQQNHIMFTKAFSSLGPFTLSLLSHHLLLLSWQNQLFSLLFPSSSSSSSASSTLHYCFSTQKTMNLVLLSNLAFGRGAVSCRKTDATRARVWTLNNCTSTNLS